MLSDFIPTHENISNLAKIDFFQGKWSILKENEKISLGNLKNKALIEGTSSSLRIEGGALKDYEVERILAGLSFTVFSEKDIAEARGYARCRTWIEEDIEEIKFNEEFIKKLSLLVSGSNEYRKGGKSPQQNILTDEPIIENAPSKKINVLLNELIEETQSLLRDESMHKIFVSGLFLEKFLSINPFVSGNGRVSRLISYYFLLNGNYSFISYSAFETIMEESRKNYMISLRKAQETNDPNPFISYYLKTLLKLLK